MEIDYITLFKAMRQRMENIQQQSLEDPYLNIEYVNLEIISDLVFSIIKAKKEEQEMLNAKKIKPGEFNDIILKGDTSFLNKIKSLLRL